MQAPLLQNGFFIPVPNPIKITGIVTTERVRDAKIFLRPVGIEPETSYLMPNILATRSTQHI